MSNIISHQSSDDTESAKIASVKDSKVYVHYDVESVEETDYSQKVFSQDKALTRGLRQRHIQMLALVGIFGTGLFLSSGGTLYLVGNVGMLVSYVFVGIIVGFNQVANIEVATLMPVTGSNIRHAEHFIDEAFGFALGWINVYGSIVPSELAATAVVMTYWSDLNPAVWISIFAVIIIATNSYTIRFYGEIEFFFGCLKVLLIVGLFLTGLIIDLGGVSGQERIGFRYWRDSPWNEYYTTGSLGRFLAFWRTISGVVYSFGGVQSISIFAGETQNPRLSIYQAGRRVFVRVFILYFITVFVLTLILSSKDPAIASSTGNAAGSPFVIAIQRAGIKGLPHVINAVVLTSAFSAANLSIVQGSRTLFALAAKRQAPKIFLKTNKRGIPYYGVIFVALFIPLAYMSSSASSSTVFSWFQSLTSSNLLLGWISISLNHIFMTRALKAQGYSRDELPYTFKFGVQSAWVSLFFSVLILLTSGFPNFLNGNFDISSFFSHYFVLPLVTVLYLFWKFFKGTKLLKPEEVNLQVLFEDVIANPEPAVEPLRGWKFLTLLWS